MSRRRASALVFRYIPSLSHPCSSTSSSNVCCDDVHDAFKSPAFDRCRRLSAAAGNAEYHHGHTGDSRSHYRTVVEGGHLASCDPDGFFTGNLVACSNRTAGKFSGDNYQTVGERPCEGEVRKDCSHGNGLRDPTLFMQKNTIYREKSGGNENSFFSCQKDNLLASGRKNTSVPYRIHASGYSTVITGQNLKANDVDVPEDFSRKNCVDVANVGQAAQQSSYWNYNENRTTHFQTTMPLFNRGAEVPRMHSAHQNEIPSKFQQNTLDHLHPSSSLSERGNSPFMALNNINDVDNTAYNGEGNSYKGTIEELDKFCNEERVKDAIKVFTLLSESGYVVDISRCLHLLQLFADTKCLEAARSVHDHIFKAVTNPWIGVHNKLLDAYIRCGSIADAYKLFEKMPQRNLTSWDTMIRGLSRLGHGEEAIDLFTKFKQLGLKPDEDMFNTVFYACTVIGAVDEGLLHFRSMVMDFGISPSTENYSSIINLFGSCGFINEAFEFIERMPVSPPIDVWETLMNLCRANGCTDLGDRCAEIIECLDSSKLMEQSKKGLLPVKPPEKKVKNYDPSELVNRFCRQREYRAGERSHPEDDLVYEQIRGLLPQLKDLGYFPEIKCVLHDIDQESREEALLYHSERLALAYALMTTAARQTVRIMKNLRVCVDCHNVLKLVSKIVGRLIIARDAKRFHHFQDGECTCRDYW